MFVEVSSLIGLSGLFLAVIGGIVARDRQITTMIYSNHEELNNLVKSTSETINNRISDDKDKFAVQYVRRDDLDSRLHHIEEAVTAIRNDMKDERRALNGRLDDVLKHIRPN